MRKISLILLSMGALLAVSLFWQGPASAQDPQMNTPLAPTDAPGGDMCWGNWWLGRRIAGSYYDEFMHYPNWPDEAGAWPGTGILTFGADGTLTWSSLGPVGDQAGGGTWEKTGYREITATVLIMGFTPDPIVGRCVGGDAEGEECGDPADCPDGDCVLQHSHSHVWTGRSRIVFEFDSDFQVATGNGCTDVFWPDQDPLGDDPFFTLPYVEHTGRKINVVPCTLDEG